MYKSCSEFWSLPSHHPLHQPVTMSAGCSPHPSSGHNVGIQHQSGSESDFTPINSATSSKPSGQSLSFPKVIIVLILCAGFGAVETFCCVIVGHGILQSHMSGFYVSIHSTAKAGAVGGIIVNGLLLPVMLSFAASRQAMTSPMCLAFLIAGHSTTIASSCVGVVILRHIPGGTLDIPHATCAAAVGYSVLTSPIMLATIFSVVQGCR
jgi:hypothetical protein